MFVSLSAMGVATYSVLDLEASIVMYDHTFGFFYFRAFTWALASMASNRALGSATIGDFLLSCYSNHVGTSVC